MTCRGWRALCSSRSPLLPAIAQPEEHDKLLRQHADDSREKVQINQGQQRQVRRVPTLFVGSGASCHLPVFVSPWCHRFRVSCHPGWVAVAELATEAWYVASDGAVVVTTVAAVDGDRLVEGLPVREFGSHAGQRHYSGLFWSATTRAHVRYESRLELDRLWLADLDPEVVGIASQPGWLVGQDGPVRRRHVPDVLLRHGAGSCWWMSSRRGWLTGLRSRRCSAGRPGSVRRRAGAIRCGLGRRRWCWRTCGGWGWGAAGSSLTTARSLRRGQRQPRGAPSVRWSPVAAVSIGGAGPAGGAVAALERGLDDGSVATAVG